MAAADLFAMSDRCAERLHQLELDLDILEPDIARGRRQLRGVMAWLGLHGAVSLAGLIAAPATLGWSLLITAGDTALLCRELNEVGVQSYEAQMVEFRVGQIRIEAAELAEILASIRSELEQR
jgi:hypothetical protein